MAANPTGARRIERYVEREFQKSGRTSFPTVRQVASALRVTQQDVELDVDGDPDSNLQLTSYGTSEERLGDYFVETVNEPHPPAPGPGNQEP